MNTISRVQELADERGLTLCQLSRMCDLSEATIRTAKKRGNQLSVDTIERICEALNITLSEFFDESPATVISQDYTENYFAITLYSISFLIISCQKT